MLLPLSHWTPVKFDIWPLNKLIDLFASLLSVPSTILFIVCACFLIVIFIPRPSKPSLWSAWNFDLALLLCSPLMYYYRPVRQMMNQNLPSCSFLRINIFVMIFSLIISRNVTLSSGVHNITIEMFLNLYYLWPLPKREDLIQEQLPPLLW